MQFNTCAALLGSEAEAVLNFMTAEAGYAKFNTLVLRLCNIAAIPQRTLGNFFQTFAHSVLLFTSKSRKFY
jgi:hypothetical protein